MEWKLEQLRIRESRLHCT